MVFCSFRYLDSWYCDMHKFCIYFCHFMGLSNIINFAKAYNCPNGISLHQSHSCRYIVQRGVYTNYVCCNIDAVHGVLRRCRRITQISINIMLSHTDDLVTRPYMIATFAMSYKTLLNSSV